MRLAIYIHLLVCVYMYVYLYTYTVCSAIYDTAIALTVWSKVPAGFLRPPTTALVLRSLRALT